MKVFSFFFYHQILIFIWPNPFPSVLLHAQILCRPNSFSVVSVDAAALSPGTALVCKFITGLIDYSLVLIIIKLMLYFPAPLER